MSHAETGCEVVAQVPLLMHAARNMSSPRMELEREEYFFFLLLGSCIKRAGACKYLGTLYARMRGGVAILLTA
jgi:hypothetical protein